MGPIKGGALLAVADVDAVGSIEDKDWPNITRRDRISECASASKADFWKWVQVPVGHSLRPHRPSAW